MNRGQLLDFVIMVAQEADGRLYDPTMGVARRILKFAIRVRFFYESTDRWRKIAYTAYDDWAKSRA